MFCFSRFYAADKMEKKIYSSHTFIELNVKIIVELHMFDGSDGPYGNFFNCNTCGNGFNCSWRTTWHAIVFQLKWQSKCISDPQHFHGQEPHHGHDHDHDHLHHGHEHDHLHLAHLMSMFLKMFLMAVQRAFVSLTIPMLPKSQLEIKIRN